MPEIQIDCAGNIAEEILKVCADVKTYYDGAFTLGFFQERLGRGKFEVHRPADGIAMLVCSGRLNCDFSLSFRTTTDEMFCFCDLAGVAKMVCPGIRQMEITEKAVAYSPLDRTEPVRCTLTAPGGRDFHYAAVYVERSAWKRLFGDSIGFLGALAPNERCALPLWTGHIPEIHSVFFELCNAHMNNAASERILICSGAMKIAAYIFEVGLGAENYPIKPEEMKNLLIANIPNRMLRDTVNPPTVQELAQELGISATKLKNGFKAIYGVPIYTMFKKMKLESAHNMLRTTSCTIGEVAFQCGYQSQSQFCDAFKRQYGVTPSKLRAQFRRAEQEKDV